MSVSKNTKFSIVDPNQNVGKYTRNESTFDKPKFSSKKLPPPTVEKVQNSRIEKNPGSTSHDKGFENKIHKTIIHVNGQSPHIGVPPRDNASLRPPTAEKVQNSRIEKNPGSTSHDKGFENKIHKTIIHVNGQSPHIGVPPRDNASLRPPTAEKVQNSRIEKNPGSTSHDKGFENKIHKTIIHVNGQSPHIGVPPRDNASLPSSKTKRDIKHSYVNFPKDDGKGPIPVFSEEEEDALVQANKEKYLIKKNQENKVSKYIKQDVAEYLHPISREDLALMTRNRKREFLNESRGRATNKDSVYDHLHEEKHLYANEEGVYGKLSASEIKRNIKLPKDDRKSPAFTEEAGYVLMNNFPKDDRKSPAFTEEAEYVLMDNFPKDDRKSPAFTEEAEYVLMDANKEKDLTKKNHENKLLKADLMLMRMKRERELLNKSKGKATNKDSVYDHSHEEKHLYANEKHLYANLPSSKTKRDIEHSYVNFPKDDGKGPIPVFSEKEEDALVQANKEKYLIKKNQENKVSKYIKQDVDEYLCPISRADLALRTRNSRKEFLNKSKGRATNKDSVHDNLNEVNLRNTSITIENSKRVNLGKFKQ